MLIIGIAVLVIIIVTGFFYLIKEAVKNGIIEALESQGLGKGKINAILERQWRRAIKGG